MSDRETKVCPAIAEGNRIQLAIRKDEPGYDLFSNITENIAKHGLFCWYGDITNEKGKEQCGLIFTTPLELAPLEPAPIIPHEDKCMCGRNTRVGEEHTGLCQLSHFVSYTGEGKHGVDLPELLRIVSVVAQEECRMDDEEDEERRQ